MQVTLFKALKSVKIDDTLATAVVEQLEDYVATKIAEVTEKLEAQNKGLESKIDSMRWQIGLLSTVIAVATIAGTALTVLSKFIH